MSTTRPSIFAGHPEIHLPRNRVSVWCTDIADHTDGWSVVPDLLFEQYEKLRVLKREARSVSFQVRDLGGRLAYLRMVTADSSEAQTAVDHLRRTAGVAHPNLATIRAAELTDDGYYYVRDWVEGRPLDPIAVGPMDSEEARRILVEASLGVAALHEARVVHGNLKPANLMLRDDRTLVITDAGLPPRRNFPPEAPAAVARYASPEQVQGRLSSPRSDVYQLGLILHELLTGRAAVSGADAASVADAHVSRKLTPPRDYRKEVPKDVEDVVVTATSKDPSHRYADASELHTALLSKGSRGLWKWIAAAAAVVVILFVAILLALPEGEDTVVAPDLIGLSVEEAGATLQTAGLQLGDVTEDDTLEAEPETVVAQDPEPGAEVAENGAVNVTIASLPDVELPDLADASEAEAVARLGQAGLRVGEVIRESHGEIAAGFVISQDPAAGSTVPIGSPVDLTVSTGPGQPETPDAALVPNVIGLQEETALETLEAAGFSTRSQSIEGTEPAGTVVEQDPAGGAEVQPGDRVTISVSEGPPELVAVPDVDGLGIIEARTSIRDAGLRVDYEFVQEGAPYLTAAGQDPAPGTMLAEGSDVTVRFSLPSFSDIPGLN